MLTNKFSAKTAEILTLVVVTMMYVALCAEADMYVPSFPEMVNFFGTSEDTIQLILSINFIGLCFAALICGPLSDAFGRRKVLLFGMLGFSISSIACVFAENFYVMLGWRLIQGMSASVPMVVGAAVFLDKYKLEKASQLVGILNSVITAAMAGAPILGAFLSSQYHWRMNFIVIAALTTVTFILTFLFIDESLPKDKRKTLNLKAIAKDYVTLATDFRFVGYCMISLMPFILIVVYIANLSLIFVNHLGVSSRAFGYYQASTMCTFLVFSALSSKLIAKKGMDYTKNLGLMLSIIGGTGLFIVAMLSPASPIWICITMSILAAGGAMTVGILGLKALEIYPDMKGTAAAMNTGIRQLLAAGLVLVSELTFDGSIVPLATIMFVYLCVAMLWYLLLQNPSKKLASQKVA